MFSSQKKFLPIPPVAFRLTIEMFGEDLISAPPWIILYPGRLPASFISHWSWLYGEEHVGITGGRTEHTKPGCSSLPAVRFISQDRSMYSNSLYLCAAYRKLYCTLLCCILFVGWLVFLLSFLHCLHSSCLWAFFVYPLARWSGHPTFREEHWPTWAWSGCPGRSYRELFTFVLIWGWNGRKPLFCILFSQNCHTLWFFCSGIFFGDFPFNCFWETPTVNTARLLVKQAENFTKFSNILSIWNCCHSCFHQSSDEVKLPQAR